MGDNSERPAAVTLDAITWPGRLCYLQVAVRAAAATVETAAVGYSIAMALRRAHTSTESVESLRVYYCVSKASRDEAAVLMQKLQEELQASWAPVFVPVVSVGSTPAADAMLLIVMLAMERSCIEVAGNQ